jgi:hypothetical protein
MSQGSTVEIASASWCHEERKILHGICMVRARYRVSLQVELLVQKAAVHDRPSSFSLLSGFLRFTGFALE